MYDFYKDIRHHYIYAIVGNDGDSNVVYVGKTCAKKGRYPFYAHTHGRIPATRYAFGPDGDCEDPQYYILEIIDCTGSTAFRHVVAWYRFFEENGFVAIISGLMLQMTEYLTPETEEIYNVVCRPVTLEVIFSREIEDVVPPPTPPTPQKPKSGMTQLNMRVSHDTADSFRDFCEVNNLTQNDAMAQLLSAAGMDFSSNVNASLLDLQYQKQMVSQLKEELGKQQKRVAALHHKEVVYRRALISFTDQIVQSAKREITHFFAKQPPLKPERYNSRRSPFYFYDYHYPTDSGCSIISFEGLARGKSKEKHGALFLLAETAEHEKIKLRYYPKPDYVGYHPTSDRYGYFGARWIVGYVIATDGATDLIAGIPLELIAPVERETTRPVLSGQSWVNQNPSSLADRINAAKERTKK